MWKSFIYLPDIVSPQIRRTSVLETKIFFANQEPTLLFRFGSTRDARIGMMTYFPFVKRLNAAMRSGSRRK
jgi:hypothetical protein